MEQSLVIIKRQPLPKNIQRGLAAELIGCLVQENVTSLGQKILVQVLKPKREAEDTYVLGQLAYIMCADIVQTMGWVLDEADDTIRVKIPIIDEDEEDGDADEENEEEDN